MSLVPSGDGGHYMRVKSSVRKEAAITEGSRARVEVTVIDRESPVELPPDLARALRAERALADFESIPPGARRFLLRKIDAAARKETREKRIREAVEAAHARREKTGR